VLLWYARLQFDRKGLHIKLFTNRNRAMRERFRSLIDCFPLLVHLDSSDAYYFRIGEVDSGDADEIYGYQPLRWFPFWERHFTTEEEFRSVSSDESCLATMRRNPALVP
jgi:hypothetical protein